MTPYMPQEWFNSYVAGFNFVNNYHMHNSNNGNAIASNNAYAGNEYGAQQQAFQSYDNHNNNLSLYQTGNSYGGEATNNLQAVQMMQMTQQGGNAGGGSGRSAERRVHFSQWLYCSQYGLAWFISESYVV